jgi:hypothetical protein
MEGGEQRRKEEEKGAEEAGEAREEKREGRGVEGAVPLGAQSTQQLVQVRS